MPTKKRKVVPPQDPTDETLEEAPQKEVKESARPITQVVEVVEEETTEATPVDPGDEDVVSAEAAPSQEEPATKEVVSDYTPNHDHHDDVPDILADDGPMRSQETTEEKRKEMVGELFQPSVEEKKEAPAPHIMPDITTHKKRTMMPIVLWALIVIVVALVTGGGLMFLTSGGALPGIAVAPTPTPTPEATPTPTPTPTVVKEDLTIEVLNGVGTAGVAGKMKTVLEDAGYTVEKTGNADTYDYEQTEIHVKPEHEGVLEMLKEDLSSEYTVGTTAADLDEDAPYDVQVIVGKE